MNKEANLIIVGGTIAAGKSTLVDGIAKATGWIAVPELRENDEVQEIILQKLYEGNRIHAATIQFYFVANRYKQYKDASNGLVTSILDRGIWEDAFFSKLLMTSDLKSYEHFKVLWRTTLDKIIKMYGKPKAYIYARVNWASFEKRIFLRGREAEIRNFEANKEYFKNLLDMYSADFVQLLNDNDIEPIIINTDELSKDNVVETALTALRKINLIKD